MECLKEKGLTASTLAEPKSSGLRFRRDPSYFQAPPLLLSEIASSFWAVKAKATGWPAARKGVGYPRSLSLWQV